MGYVLINGKRFYQDDRGNATLDNVSQEEADRRERRNSAAFDGHTGSGFGTSSGSPSSGSVARTISTRHTVPWRVIILLGMILMVIGALIYNQMHVSLAERTIENYMENESGTTSGSVEKSDYIIPDSAERYIDSSEIQNCSHDEIQLMINEIYARHGREFYSQDNKDHFSGREWYSPITGKTDEEIVQEFNEYEKANVDLLSEYL